MNKPTLCGSNRINLPTSGCSDCDQLAYRIDQLEEWIRQFEEDGYNALANKPTINGVTVEGDKTSEEYLITGLSESDIISVTPIECYEPTCKENIVCVGETCCMVLTCNESTSSEVCVGGVCYAQVACESDSNEVCVATACNARVTCEETPTCEDYGTPWWSAIQEADYILM